MEPFCKILFGEFQETKLKGGNKSRRHDAINVIVSNLVKHQERDKELYIHYSRDANLFSNKKRYNPVGLGYDPYIQTIEALKELGYLEDHPGKNNRDGGKSFSSRMVSTPKFIWKVKKNKKLKWDCTVSIHSDPIVLRDKKKKLANYTDDDKTNRMRKQVEKYNDALRRLKIGISSKNEDIKKQISGENVVLSEYKYHRVFNNLSFEQGGRFYGPWWLGIDKKLRRFLTINDRPTVELDFKAIQINMLYCMEGLNYAKLHGDEDPYLLPAYKLEHRDALKLATLILINARTETKAKRAMTKNLRDEGLYFKGWDSRKFLDAFREKHKLISHHVASGIGIELQYKDSQISEYIIDRCLKKNIPVLCIHDGFITQKKHKKELLNAMKQGYRNIGLSPVPPIVEV